MTFNALLAFWNSICLSLSTSGSTFLFALLLAGRSTILLQLLLLLAEPFRKLLDFLAPSDAVARGVMYLAPCTVIIAVGRLMGAFFRFVGHDPHQPLQQQLWQWGASCCRQPFSFSCCCCHHLEQRHLYWACLLSPPLGQVAYAKHGPLWPWRTCSLG
jgi:hypothetical protein